MSDPEPSKENPGDPIANDDPVSLESYYEIPSNEPSLALIAARLWLSPREATKMYLSRKDNDDDTLYLYFLGTVATVLNRASSQPGRLSDFQQVLITGATAGALNAGVFSWLSGKLIGIAGRRLGGVGSDEACRAAFALSSVPVIATLPLWIPLGALYGNQAFLVSAPLIDANPLPGVIASVAIFVLWLWSLISTIQVTAEAHQISASRALAAWALLLGVPAVIGIAALLLLAR